MRYRILSAALLLFGTSMLTGCMTLGKEFNYQRVNELVLGEKPAADYDVMFGQPRTVKTRKDPDGAFKQVVYVYAAMYEGARVLTLEYKDDTVNAYYYSSSFNGEKTQVDAGRFEQVEIGQTKEEVEQLLGKPNGQALCPCYLKLYEEHCGIGDEIWSWYSVSNPNDRSDSSSKAVSMFVIFDRKGAVVNTLQEQVNSDR